MPKLIMKLDDSVVKEFVIGTSATIGRLPDNTVRIDNPAISSHHARIFQDGDRFVVEDLKSKNGTFVNDKLVLTRRTLQTGDIVAIGKHKLFFDEALLVDNSEAVLEELGDTVYLDTQGHRELLAKLRAFRWGTKPAAAAPAPEEAPAERAPAMPAAAERPAKVGVLRVLAGSSEQQEYPLEANTTFIGKSDQAVVRLKGWFKPKVAVAIARHDGVYVATPYGGEPQINNQRLRGRHALQDGDVLDVSGLVLEFRWAS
ncbi:MAG TPA: FHA domain-containing protein [Vicinamibacterales bacterium]|jgi:pSer/pThr/pTyr-binding forkhead associated (FHA) protein